MSLLVLESIAMLSVSETYDVIERDKISYVVS
jgi:hypothetical protein